MGANTYPDPRVSRFINEYTIPVQFNVKEDVGAQSRFHAHWTPALVFQDVDGIEYRRSFGSLNADQFLAEFWLARGLRYYHSGQFDKATEIFEEALEHTKFDPLRHSENLYWIGPAKYEGSGSLDDLINGFKKVQEAYPGSDWAKKTVQLKMD